MKNYKHFVMHASFVYGPQFYHEASKFLEWCKDISEEIVALEANNIWTVQPLPYSKKNTNWRWIYKTNFKVDRNLDRHKSYLVAKGFTQHYLSLIL